MVKHARCYLLCSLYKSFEGRWEIPLLPWLGRCVLFQAGESLFSTVIMTLFTVSRQRVILLPPNHATDRHPSLIKLDSPREVYIQRQTPVSPFALLAFALFLT